MKQKADELLKRIWTDEDEDPEVNTYHFNMLKRTISVRVQQNPRLMGQEYHRTVMTMMS